MSKQKPTSVRSRIAYSGGRFLYCILYRYIVLFTNRLYNITKAYAAETKKKELVFFVTQVVLYFSNSYTILYFPIAILYDNWYDNRIAILKEHKHTQYTHTHP